MFRRMRLRERPVNTGNRFIDIAFEESGGAIGAMNRFDCWLDVQTACAAGQPVNNEVGGSPTLAVAVLASCACGGRARPPAGSMGDAPKHDVSARWALDRSGDARAVTDTHRRVTERYHCARLPDRPG